MKKKVVILLLSTTVAAVAISGCGKKQSTESVTESVTESTEVATESIEEETESEETTTETETEVEEKVISATMFAQDKVNVYASASTDGEVLGYLSTNDPVIVNGTAVDGWYNVTYCEKTAYVEESHLGTGTVEIKKAESNSSSKSNNSSKSNASSNTSGNAGTSTPAQSTPTQSTPAQSTPTQSTPTPAAETPEQSTPAAETPANDATGQVQQAIIDGGGYIDGNGAAVNPGTNAVIVDNPDGSQTVTM